MILFVGQVARRARDREGFQEVNFRAMFEPLAKWVAEIDDAARIPEYVARAFHTAMVGRPGPVVLSLPEDVLSESGREPAQCGPVVVGQASPCHADIEKLMSLLSAASRPLLVVGGTGWSQQACTALQTFATRNGLPVVSSFRRQDLIDNRQEVYCGQLGLGIDPALAERVRAADVIVSVGSRLSENTTSGYTLLRPPVPDQRLVHVHPDPEEIGRVYQPEISIVSSLAEFAHTLAGIEVDNAEARRTWLETGRADYLKFSTPSGAAGDFVDLSAVVGWLSEHLGEDALVANGAGNYTVWVHRYFRYRRPRTELAPISGAMGYGVPAAIAAKLRHPDREVVAFAGDGCFLMYPQELATAMQYRANIVILVVNNGRYGTIRMHQERRFPGRVIATDIQNPDFVALARSFGAYGEHVEHTQDFPDTFRRATAAGRPAVLELRVDPMQLTPSMRLNGAPS